MNRSRRRRAVPPLFGDNVDDQALLAYRQIDTPEDEEGFAWLIGRTKDDGRIQPTGRWEEGVSKQPAPIDHEHPTALIHVSDTQTPVEYELRIGWDDFLYFYTDDDGWKQVSPLGSDDPPQPTGVQGAGVSLRYSRADHSHPTALIPQSSSQTPVPDELRYTSSQTLVLRSGNDWVPIKVDWADVLNKPSRFPVGVRHNTGSTTFERPRLNFIEGSNITITVSDDDIDNEVDITISATGGGGGGGTPYNDPPQPTGIQNAGTAEEYSRGDHSHPTALIAEGHSQTPVERELRYNTSDALVMRVGSNWVPVKIDWGNVLNKPSTFPPSSHTHPLSDLTQSGASAGQFVKWSGTQWVPSNVDWSDVQNKPSVFPITVRRNSGSNIGTRSRLNFIEGSNIAIAVSDDATDNEIDITISASVPSPSNTTPQPTGVASAGSSAQYSRGDHSHPTALIAEGNVQPPVERELRYNTSDALVMRVGTTWVPVKIDWADVLNKPNAFPPSSHTHSLSDLTQSGASANQFVKWGGTQWIPSFVDWGDVQNKPSTFPPSSHTHPLSHLTQSGASTHQFVKWSGSQWVPSFIDWSDVQGKPSAFPVIVRRNSGLDIGTRSRLNFIEGSNITLTIADDATNSEVDITIAATVPSPSNATPQPTGVASAGTSSQYSRSDHSHALVLISETHTQTPVADELRYNTEGRLVRRVGSSWVPFVQPTNRLIYQTGSRTSGFGLTNLGDIDSRDNGNFYVQETLLTSTPVANRAVIPITQGRLIKANEFVWHPPTGLENLTVATNISGHIPFYGAGAALWASQFLLSPAGASASDSYFIIPVGVIFLHKPIAFRLWVEIHGILHSTASSPTFNNPSIIMFVGLHRLTVDTPTNRFFRRYFAAGNIIFYQFSTVSNSSTNHSRWLRINASDVFDTSSAVWERFDNYSGTSTTNTTVDTPNFYFLMLGITRHRASETTPRNDWYISHAWVQPYATWNVLHFTN